MLDIQQSPLYIAIVVYLVIALLLFFIKPSFFFDDNGDLKDLGVDKSETIISYPLFLVILGGILYFITLVSTNFINNI